VQSTTDGQRSLLEGIQPTLINENDSSRLPLFYRYTPLKLNSLEQVREGSVLWENVSGFVDGHSTPPMPGYHWYTIKVRGEDSRNLAWFLAFESSWWSDLGAWVINTDREGFEQTESLTPMNAFGVRYHLTTPAGSTSTILVRYRVSGRSLNRAHYYLSNDQTVFVEKRPVLLGCMLGLCFFILIYNLGYFILVREVSYFYFGSTVIGLGGALCGDLGAWSFFGFPQLMAIGPLGWMALFMVPGGLMVGRIASVGDYPVKLHRSLDWLLVASVVAYLGWLVSQWGGVFKLLNILYLLIVMNALVISYAGWRRGERFMGTFFCSLAPVCLSLVYTPLVRSGLLPNFFGSDYFYFSGTIFFLVMICSLLPLRFRQEVISRDLLGQSLLEKEKRLSEIDGEVRDIGEVLDALRAEDESIRTSLTNTQKSRIDTEKKLRDSHHQLRHLEYHVSLGRLVAGVAHDIANPATHISSCAQNFDSLIHKLKEGDDDSWNHLKGFSRLEESCAGLSAQSAYIVRVNQALARYGRIDDSVSSEVDLSSVVDQVLCVIASRVQLHDVECRFEDVPFVTAKPGQMSQMLANLILNAADAIVSQTDKGRILISAEPAPREEGTGVYLIIEDSGPGIPGIIRRAGFRPFVTTRDPARWLGIGLSIVKRIIDEHGGDLSFPPARELSGGAVRVWLPLRQAHES
jgi:two-component system, NtrC family, sensor kinase